MTALTIIPDYGKKRLRLVGTVAAGEHVSVRVIGGAEWIQPGEDAEVQTLRLRVLFGGHTVAMFPRPEQPDADPSEPTDEWSEDPEDPSDAACELNLNSIPAEKLLRCGGECLCILDDPVNHTMYGAGEFRVEPWPKMRPADEPYSLDDYPDFVQEAKDAIAAAQSAIEEALDEASGIVAQAQSAKTVATDAAAAATGSANAAAGSADLAAGSASAAASSASDASAAAAAAEEARDSIQPPVNPLTEEEVEDGRAADAASTGAAISAVSDSVGRNAERIAKNADDIETAVGLLRSHASGETAVAGNPIHVSTQDRQNWNGKADKTELSRFVDSAEYDGNSRKILLKNGDATVAWIDATPFIVDGMVESAYITPDGAYLVITFNTDAGKQPINIPLTDIFNPENYYDKTQADALLGNKEDIFTPAEIASPNLVLSVNAVVKNGAQEFVVRIPTTDGLPTPSTSTPLMDGTASAGSSDAYARGDHVHPTDTTRASTADATLNGRGFGEWTWEGTPPTYEGKQIVLRLEDYPFEPGVDGKCWVAFTVDGDQCSVSGDSSTRDDDNTRTTVTIQIDGGVGPYTATRTALPGYVLGSQTDKPLASEAEAEELRAGKLDKSAVVAPSTSSSDSGKAADAKATGEALAGKQDALSAQQLANIAALPEVFTITGRINLQTLAISNVDRTYAEVVAARAAGKTLRLVLDYSGGNGYCVYGWGTDDVSGGYPRFSIVVNLGASIAPYFVYTALHSDNGWDTSAAKLATTANVPYDLVTKTISNGVVTLDDRASNAVAVSSALASLTVNFPTATSGKARDFAMRLNIAAGATAPELVLPQGVVCENTDGEVPEIADGGTGGSSTILYFSETENDGTTAKFLVKGETLTAITQA